MDGTPEGLLAEERWPCVSGVYLASGAVVLIECALDIWLRPLAESTLSSVLDFSEAS